MHGTLQTSADAFPDVSPQLNPDTLQQVRLFGEDAELMLWRTDSGWQARLLQDQPGDETRYYDEPQILWGSQQRKVASGFTLITDGQQGQTQ
ncbi:MAG: TIGR03984 family CRISPR-associated protein, partial [Okeania sp. SIO3B3]|nr:TIGR03984 family CRISPR-associated protein [Okeania sp. SIO3B3]